MKTTSATTLKRIISLFAILAGSVITAHSSNAGIIVYEGFCHGGVTETARVGWLTNWRQGEGEVRHIGNDLKYDSLQSCAGAIQLKGPKVTVASQLDVPLLGTTYGTARVQTGQLKSDSVVAITMAGPETEDVVPKNSNISLILKGWRQELGTISRRNVKSETVGGSPMQSNSEYMVLWKMEQPKLLTMWILSEEQVNQFTKLGLSTDLLDNAELGTAPDNVMQRVTAKLSRKLDIDRGYLLSCFTLACPGTIFDEIRISDSSLAEAAGL